MLNYKQMRKKKQNQSSVSIWQRSVKNQNIISSKRFQVNDV